MNHKKVLVLIIVMFLFLTGCNQREDGVEVIDLPKVTDALTVTESPIITVEPTVTIEPLPTEPVIESETFSKDEVATEDTFITFTGIIDEVTKDGAIVITSDLNHAVTEKVTLSFDRVWADSVFVESPNPVTAVCIKADYLQKGDQIQVQSNYAIDQGKKIICQDAFCFADLIQSTKKYDMASERVMAKAGMADCSMDDLLSCQLSYQPKEYKNKFVVKEKQKDKMNALIDVLNSYPIFYQRDVKKSNQEFCPITLTFETKDGTQYHLSWNEEVVYLSDSKSDRIQMYQFYYQYHPDMECISQLFYTKDSISELVKNCISYEDITEYKEYPMNRGYAIDLNQDGKKEMIFVAPYGDDLWYNHFSESVELMGGSFGCFLNKKYCCELNQDFLDTTRFDLMDLDPNDHRLELVFHNRGPSDDYFLEFYQYNDNKLESIGQATTNEFQVIADPDQKEKKAIKGNKRLGILQTWYAKAVWQLDSKGQIKEMVPELYIPITTTNFRLRYDMNGYQEMNLDSERVSIKKGELHALLTDNKSWIQVETVNHKKVWIYLENGFEIRESDITDASYQEAKEQNDYVELFDGLCMCD